MTRLLHPPATTVFALVVGVCLLLGCGVGWLWTRLGSDPGVVEANLALGALGFGAGMLWSLIAMLTLGRGHPDAVLWGSVAGGLVGSVVAYRIGLAIGPDRPNGSDGGVSLPAPGVLLMWSLAACLVGFGVGVARRVGVRLSTPSDGGP